MKTNTQSSNSPLASISRASFVTWNDVKAVPVHLHCINRLTTIITRHNSIKSCYKKQFFGCIIFGVGFLFGFCCTKIVLGEIYYILYLKEKTVLLEKHKLRSKGFLADSYKETKVKHSVTRVLNFLPFLQFCSWKSSRKHLNSDIML